MQVLQAKVNILDVAVLDQVEARLQVRGGGDTEVGVMGPWGRHWPNWGWALLDLGVHVCFPPPLLHPERPGEGERDRQAQGDRARRRYAEQGKSWWGGDPKGHPGVAGGYVEPPPAPSRLC